MKLNILRDATADNMYYFLCFESVACVFARWVFAERATGEADENENSAMKHMLAVDYLEIMQ